MTSKGIKPATFQLVTLFLQNVREDNVKTVLELHWQIL
jgi:hypothetical protein